MYDSRDTHPYTVVKLKDGNCWMQENLALTPPAGSKLRLNGGINGDTALAQGTTSWDLEDKWTNSATTMPAMKVGNENTMTNYKAEYGNYYNWCAATAGSCAAATKQNDIAGGSICPKGWHLPSSGVDTNNNNAPSGEFGALFGENGKLLGSTVAEAVAKIQTKPYKFPLSGRINNNNGVYTSGGPSGFYWSSTARNDTGAYYLTFGGSTTIFYPSGGDNRAYGFSVRCVADY